MTSIALMFNNFSSFELYCDEFTIKGTKILQAALMDYLIMFYTSRINKQLYWVLANAEIIGNPKLFFKQISSAFREFFSEMGSYLGFNVFLSVYGVLKSSKSLLKNVMNALSESGSMIFKNIQNGLFFKFAEEHRRIINNRVNIMPEQSMDSLESILKSFANLAYATVLFPFSQPIMPYVLKKRKKLNKAGYEHYLKSKQKRLKRMIGRDKVLRPFNELQARIQNFTVENGEMIPTTFVMKLETTTHLLIQTQKGVVVVDKKSNQPTDYMKTSLILNSQLIEDSGVMILEYEESTPLFKRKDVKFTAENETGHLKKIDFKVLDIENAERFLDNLKKNNNTSLNRTNSFGSLNSSLQKISIEQD